MVERIEKNKQLFAIIIRNSFKREGIEFFTEDSFSPQLGYMNRPQGYRILPHSHNHVVREVLATREVLFIKSGKVRVDFYDDNQKYLESRILYRGDVILLAAGGHGFEMLESSEMVEVKQGPYVGQGEKISFESVPTSKLNIKE